MSGNVLKKVAFVALFAAVLVSLVQAEPPGLKPDGWTRISRDGGVAYMSPDGVEMIVVHESNDDVEPIALAKKYPQGIAANYGGAKNELESQEGSVSVYSAVFGGSNGDVIARSFATRTENGVINAFHIAKTDNKAARARSETLRLKVAALSAIDVGSVAPLKTVDTSPKGPNKNSIAVESTVFDINYRSGVGGFTYPNYLPVYLFSDGRACRCAEVAPVDLNEDALTEVKKSRIGTWTRTREGIVIDYDGGATQEKVDPKRSLPTPLPQNVVLEGNYESIGGGGNTAFGGGTMTASVKELTFHRDGSFDQASLGFGTAPSGSASARRGAAGLWSASGATLTLDYHDGRSVRTSIFFDSHRKSSAEFGQLGVVWIGGDDYKRRE